MLRWSKITGLAVRAGESSEEWVQRIVISRAISTRTAISAGVQHNRFSSNASRAARLQGDAGLRGHASQLLTDVFDAHFGFKAPPFRLGPDPSFYFESSGHGKALAYLKYGVYQREGFIVVTGEIGSGKTTLVRKLLESLDPREVTAAQVVSTQLDSYELLRAVCTAFGVPVPGSSKALTLATLEAFFAALAADGRRALLIVDEAQNLGLREAEELRMLSNFQLGGQGLVQSFLVGQPELRLTLRSSSMEQLRQRVIASCHLGRHD